jgi:hypothetical protein
MRCNTGKDGAPDEQSPICTDCVGDKQWARASVLFLDREHKKMRLEMNEQFI